MPQTRPIVTVGRPVIDVPGRRRSVVIRGRVVDERRGTPVAGVRLTLLTAADPRGEVIDETSTDRRGEFELQVPDLDADTRTRTAFVRVASFSGEPLAPLREVTLARGRALTIQVPFAAVVVDDATWRTVAELMEESRLVRMNEVVRQLLHPGPDGAFAKLEVSARYQVMAQLEHEFVDPTGLLRANWIPTSLSALADEDTYDAAQRSVAGDDEALAAVVEAHARAHVFDHIGKVDWVVDTAALATAQPAQAMAKYSDVYTVSLSNADSVLTGSQPFDELMKVYPPSDLSRYRDYLLTIYTGSQSSAGFGTRRAKLRTRFHQLFSGTDVGPQPANAILHGIVRKILLAPQGAEYGFGLSAGVVPAQGDLTHRAYLEQLVALSGVPRNEFGLRYRLDLDRPDSVESSVVQEQINTLQAFYNDGFRSMVDPFPAIPEKLRDKPPFYLYFTEWERREGTFHPENFFQPESCFGLAMTDGVREALLAANEYDEDDPDRKWFIALVKAEEAFANGLKRYRLQQYASATEEYERAETHVLVALSLLPTYQDLNATFGVINDALEYWSDLALSTLR